MKVLSLIFLPGLLLALAWPVAAHAQLALTQTPHEIVVTSDAGPTWRIVIAVASEATPEKPGGGTVRALHVPANNPESLFETEPRRFGLARWGVDSLEWRYIDNKKGVRSALGTTATIDSLAIVKQTSQEIIIALAGRWKNIPRFTRRIEITPRGFHTRIEADWDGPTDKRAMWWLLAVPRSSVIDQNRMMITDADTPATPLPVAWEGVFPLPKGITFPYEVSLPTKRGPIPELRLRMNVFGTDQPAGLRYELWPEEHGAFKFFPRWVDGHFEQRRYVFDYEWNIVPTESPAAGSLRN